MGTRELAKSAALVASPIRGRGGTMKQEGKVKSALASIDAGTAAEHLILAAWQNIHFIFRTTGKVIQS